MPTTPNWNLPLYGPSDTAELDVLLNGQSNALDTALTSGITSFIGTDTQRGALTAPRLREGITWRTTDTDIDWYYDGTNWIAREAGMYIVRPASLAIGTGMTIKPNGHIDLGSSGDTLHLNNVFTSRFRRYKIVIDWAVSGGMNGSRILLSTGGSPNSGANYWNQYVSAGGPTVTASFDLETQIPVSGINATYHAAEVDIWAPAVADITKWGLKSWASGGAGAMIFRGGDFENTTVFDGFRFQLSTTGAGRSFQSGDLAVYGLG